MQAIVPGMSHNLLSVGQLLNKGFKVFFNDELFWSKIVKDECVFYCNGYNNLFVLKIDLNENFDKEKCLVID